MADTMSTYAIPQLISTLFLFSLGIVSLLSGRKERLWKIFSTFCFLLMMGAWFGFLIASGRSEIASNFFVDRLGIELNFVSLHARLAPVFGFLSIMFAVFYSVALIGMPIEMKVFGKKILFDFGGDRFRIDIWGYKVGERPYFLFVIAFSHLFALLFMHAGADVSIKYMGNWPGLDVTYGPLGYIMACFVIAGFMKVIYFLIYAYKLNQSKIYREFIVLNIIAFLITYVSALTLGVLLPIFGIPTQLYSSSFFPLAVIIFYVAIMRYQFARVDEVNLNLEQKVEERTGELKDAYTRMVQSEKMASLGQLVAGVAHEINNPIGAISSSQQNMKRSVEKLQVAFDNSSIDIENSSEFSRPLKVMKDAYRVIGDGSQRVTEIVSKLKSFSKLDESEMQIVDLHEGINDTLSLLEHDFNGRITIEKEYGSLPKIDCNPRQLNQVWLNLLVNAIDVLGEGGKISISTNQNGKNVFVEIKDNGPGIDVNNLKRIFDPGYTTKGRGTGTGLGLAICYQIIEAHNGKIEVQSTPDNGTTFTITLPVEPVMSAL
jgi:signal transduction histidine kinase